MINKSINMLTDNFYFYYGFFSLLGNNETVADYKFNVKPVRYDIENIFLTEYASVWIVDIDSYSHDILRYFEVMDAMVNMKKNYSNRSQVILCYNKFVCLPLSACYKLFSVINIANDFSSVIRDFNAAIEPSSWYQRSCRASGKTEQRVLTRAEYKVLKALSRGENVKRVAYHYQRSPKTINHHKCSGLNKMKRKRLSSLYC